MAARVLRILGILAILMWGGLNGGVVGCSVSVSDPLLDSTDFSYTETTTTTTSYSTGESIPTNDKLLIDGQGEAINVEYNELVFSALFNYDDGKYYFAPDPDGWITGDRIVCDAVIDQDQVQGDCFRQGLVCHFNYWSDYTPTNDGKDVYSLDITSCRRGGQVGPFLVPLNSPMCGEDPFPACPDYGLFPMGPGSDTPPPPQPPPPPPGT